MPYQIRFTDQQCLGILAIAFPELYAAAATSTPLWVTLWYRDECVLPDAVMVTPELGARKIRLPDTEWRPPVPIDVRYIEIGVATSADDPPFVRIQPNTSSQEFYYPGQDDPIWCRNVVAMVPG